MLFLDEFEGVDSLFAVKLKEPLPVHNISIITSRNAPQSAAKEAFVKQLRKYAKLKDNEAKNRNKWR